MYEHVTDFIKSNFKNKDFIPLHEPKFMGNEKKYLNECIDSTFVSSVGKFVDEFEKNIALYTGSKYAIATTNGTSALHVALHICGVAEGDEVITQPVTFIATANAITYCNAVPVFIDVDKKTMGMSPDSLRQFLENNTSISNGKCINLKTKRTIRACLPMHTFGLPCQIEEIASICAEYNISLVEDAAESLGSTVCGKHTGTFGKAGVLSFNGNKIITSGGGGCIITNDEKLAKLAKHITTTAKVPHRWEYTHDTAGFNYRLPNVNAALLVAQLEQIETFLKNKRELAHIYKDFFLNTGIDFAWERDRSKSNYWLNAVILKDKQERDIFLQETNDAGVMTRPIWTLMNKLEMYKRCQTTDLSNSVWLEDRVVNIPSSVRI